MLTLLYRQPIYKYHMNYYKTVQFKFSDLSWAWLEEFFNPIVLDYQQNAPAINALVTLKDHEYNQLTESTAWTELVTFLKTYNIIEPYPQLFIYKRLPQPRKVILGNPHIDTTGQESTTAIDVPMRFNILMHGDEDTEMVWWDHGRNSSTVVESKFVRPDYKTVGLLQAHGNNLIEKWEAVGEPVARCNTLAKKQEYASFVRTDVLHALNWTGSNPRLILSARSTQPWPF